MKPRYKYSDNEALDALREAHRRAWQKQSSAENCTVSGNMTRGELENLIVEHWIRDGEVFVERVIDFKNNATGFALRIIDPAMLATNYNNGEGDAPLPGQRKGERVICGIGVDKDYRKIAYYFRRPPPRESAWVSSYYTGEIMRVPARDIFHIHSSSFANQLRGVSWLAPVLTTVEGLKRYVIVAETAARMGAAKHFTIKTASGSSTGDLMKEVEEGEEQPPPEIDLNGDGVNVLGPDDEASFHDPSYPHDQFEPYVKMTQKGIALGLDVAPLTVTGDLSDVNFSTAQIVVADERAKWKSLQAKLADGFIRWWHDEWVRWSLLRGDIKYADGKPVLATMYETLIDVDFCGMDFTPIDPLKAANAARVRLENGMSSQRQEIELLNKDADQTFEEIAADRRRNAEENKISETR